ncbi:magnesium transporter CorA family protein [Pseudochryseolinea flava]|uniref:Magnesium transporter CorA n=1 Tax=Pseudochryseolinea flava TaxID=2059302 RepID=A0A364XYF1_9BACT|nr:CorA family divalent cation transporter [Pseudochryseolinea flava]RAV99287.1 magnesium transporter CorA [Pseudochryseolinea flava]
MIRNFFTGEFKWIDILDPTADDMHNIALEYHIHEAFVADVLQPEHLPKYEPVEGTSFFILRYFDPDDKLTDTIQGLTNKIAIFQTDNVVITIHRKEIQFLNEVHHRLTSTNKCDGTCHLLNKIIKQVFLSFEQPAFLLAQEIDHFEAKVFLKKNTPALEDMYHAKRKIEVIKRILILSKDILEKIDGAEHRDPETRDTRDLYVRVLTLYDAMADNTNHILTLYFSISSQRTNEVIRILTLFSVFFMPLTFIVGIYGMNFRHMPELEWKLGYPLMIIVMAMVSLIIYKWFKRKEWL